jgi:nicotinamide-nucleotide amidase
MIAAEIISIGDEILTGLTINTNSTWLAAELYKHGYNVKWITTIADESHEIRSALIHAEERARVIIITGGLGPTPDDLTRQAISLFFNRKLILHEETLAHIRKMFEVRKLKMPEVNRNQAMIPEGADIISNPVGTAPGLMLEKSDTYYFFLPGVPIEMERMFTESVLDILQVLVKSQPPLFHLIRTTGLPESLLIEKIGDILEESEPFLLSFLPKTSGVDIRIRLSKGFDDRIEFSSFINRLTERLDKYIYAETEKQLTEIIGEMLIQKKLSLCVAESFTGGLISDTITEIAGSSAYFTAGIVTYSNRSKTKFLGVKSETISELGAVSETVAQEMAIGAQKRFGTDCAISSTGIAGPGGATADKPVGLCYLAARCGSDSLVRKFNFGKDRRMNKERGTAAALELLRRLLLNMSLP